MWDKEGITKAKLCPFSLGLGVGVAEAIYLFLFALAGYFFGYGNELITQIGHTLHGYAPTVMGGLIGAAWGFVDGFIFGFIIAFVYNLCVCCRCKKREIEEKK